MKLGINMLRPLLFLTVTCVGFQSVSEDYEGSAVDKEPVAAISEPSPSRMPSSMIDEEPRVKSNLCDAVKTNKGLDFKTSTSYVSSVLKKAGLVEVDHASYSGHANKYWDKFLSKNNFIDISEAVSTKEKFSFDQLRDGSLIVLEKGCFKEGAVALYCGGKYFATKFVKTSSLLKKINGDHKSCQLGSGLRIVVGLDQVRGREVALD